MEVRGRIVDIHQRSISRGVVRFLDGVITEVIHDESVTESQFILPGFIDAHVHVESSLMVPSEFAKLAVTHGTVGTVSDPHEIANVCGMDGIRFMINNAGTVPFHFAFGAPSCVPATSFETAGSEISADDIEELFQDERIRYLSEVMNWPGVLSGSPDVLQKIALAKKHGREVDGHAPGLMGKDAVAYAGHGISTDHECFTLDEAQDKLNAGMKILIREGSAARNYEALHSLIGSHPDQIMFCCDDAHPDLLMEGHIDRHVKHSVERGYDLFDVLRAATINPIVHYGLPVGMLRVGDSADFIVVDDLYRFDVLQTWIKGEQVSEHGVALFETTESPLINNFARAPISIADLACDDEGQLRVIVAHDGQLITSEEEGRVGDPDVLKLVVVNRYSNAPVSVAYVKGFGLNRGALASSVAHDSHNILAVGCSDTEIVNAVNAVVECRGGLAVCSDNKCDTLPLPVAGLMSNKPASEVAKQYIQIDMHAKAIGSMLRAPFMTLSFMALLVIPQIKLSDKGLFDGSTFRFLELKK